MAANVLHDAHQASADVFSVKTSKCKLQKRFVWIHLAHVRQVAVFYFIPAVVFLIFLFSSYDTEVPTVGIRTWTICDHLGCLSFPEISEILGSFLLTYADMQLERVCKYSIETKEGID